MEQPVFIMDEEQRHTKSYRRKPSAGEHRAPTSAAGPSMLLAQKHWLLLRRQQQLARSRLDQLATIFEHRENTPPAQLFCRQVPGHGHCESLALSRR